MDKWRCPQCVKAECYEGGWIEDVEFRRLQVNYLPAPLGRGRVSRARSRKVEEGEFRCRCCGLIAWSSRPEILALAPKFERLRELSRDSVAAFGKAAGLSTDRPVQMSTSLDVIIGEIISLQEALGGPEPPPGDTRVRGGHVVHTCGVE